MTNPVIAMNDPEVSPVTANKKIARKFMELVNENKIDELCELIAPEWTIEGALPGLPPGPEGMRKLFKSFGRVEQKWTIEDVIAEGNRVVVRATNVCNQDSFLGVSFYGQKQVFTAIFIHRIINNKISKTWRNADDLGRVLQGLVPAI